MVKFILNNQQLKVDINPSVTTVDFLRYHMRLTGTKIGCREGDCGACTVLSGEIRNGRLSYRNVNSCILPVGALNGKHLVTIEGINSEKLNLFQKMMVEESGTQCGFCTPGFIVSFAGYLLSSKNYNIEDAVEYLSGNLCRCTGHTRIIKAVERTIAKLSEQRKRSDKDVIKFLTEIKFLPDYFKDIRKKLDEIRIEKSDIETNNFDVLVSGGTDLLVQQWEELPAKKVKFITDYAYNKPIKENAGEIVIKGNATIEQLKGNSILRKYITDIDNIISLFGSKPIRNRATVAGNINNASPIADIVNILLALNSKLVLKKGSVKRKILLREYFIGYKKLDRRKNEIIEEIIFDKPKENYFFNYEKVSKRTYLDIASVNSSIFLKSKNDRISEIHISAGGVSPIPLYLRKASDFLTGRKIDAEAVKESIKKVNSEISPISDARGSAEYKRLLLRQLIYCHFIKLFPEKIKAEDLIC